MIALIAGVAFARLAGVVTDANDGKPIAGVQVVAGDRTETTAADGRYGFRYLEAGPARLRFRDGDVVVTRDLDLAPGREAELDVSIDPLEPVVTRIAERSGTISSIGRFGHASAPIVVETGAQIELHAGPRAPLTIAHFTDEGCQFWHQCLGGNLLEAPTPADPHPFIDTHSTALITVIPGS